MSRFRQAVSHNNCSNTFSAVVIRALQFYANGWCTLVLFHIRNLQVHIHSTISIWLYRQFSRSLALATQRYRTDSSSTMPRGMISNQFSFPKKKKRESSSTNTQGPGQETTRLTQWMVRRWESLMESGDCSVTWMYPFPNISYRTQYLLCSRMHNPANENDTRSKVHTI